MERLIGCGALFQITAASLSNPGLRGPALKMIRMGYVHAVASDAHDTLKRPPILSVAYEIISRKIDEEIANRLFTHNPLKIIQGGDVE
jgi:protein-tyrosine phosphatase